VRNRKNAHRLFTSTVFALAIVNPIPMAAQAAAPTGTPLKSHMEELSYAIGANLGNSLRGESVTVDPNLLLQGLKDGLAGKPVLLSPHEVNVIVNAFQGELRAKKIKEEAQKLVASEELADKNKKAGEAFLRENKTKAGITTLESGLQYKILKAGDGRRPAANDTVACAYQGRFVDGTEFDSSVKNHKPAIFPLPQIIRGWSQALQLMPVGSKWELFVPSDLAYGSRGMPPVIGPNATLIFEVELLSIQEGPREPAQSSTTPAGISNRRR
jgi:FKBP-type peptidyl-prolyl cis-trans isomerase FklB